MFPTDIREICKKEEKSLKYNLFKEHLTQDLRSVYEGGISTKWTEQEGCILYIEDENKVGDDE